MKWSWHVAMRPGEFDILYVMYEIQHGWWSGRPDASPLLTRPLCFQIMLLVKEWGRRRERKDRDVKRFVIHRYMTHAMERGRLLTIHWAMETIGLWRQHVERTVCGTSIHDVHRSGRNKSTEDINSVFLLSRKDKAIYVCVLLYIGEAPLTI